MSELKEKYDVIVVGAGVSGLNCAINLPSDKEVLLICKDTLQHSDSFLAQGGICVQVDDGDFSTYFEDTMRAGHYENSEDSVRCMISESRATIAELISYGVQFARHSDGSLNYTREGGHSVSRICFHEDCTGKEISEKLLAEAEKRKNIQTVPQITMLDFLTDGKECCGIVARENSTGKILKIYSDYTVLATGGIGGVFESSTNYRILTGDAIAMCIKRGVRVDNINYIQVHPTTLFTHSPGRRFLISESVRGEGARLLDKNFQPFTDELQPRDVVSAAIKNQMEKDGTEFVWLDMRTIPRGEVESHFPDIVKRCREEGYDVFSECIPVVPAQHYFMGGIHSDLQGRTTLARLYAVGETCCNGVHGRNRLASNSLLESLVFAKRAAKDIAQNYSESNLRCDIREQDYSDADALLDSYKQTVIQAILSANEKEKKI